MIPVSVAQHLINMILKIGVSIGILQQESASKFVKELHVNHYVKPRYRAILMVGAVKRAAAALKRKFVAKSTLGETAIMKNRLGIPKVNAKEVYVILNRGDLISHSLTVYHCLENARIGIV